MTAMSSLPLVLVCLQAEIEKRQQLMAQFKAYRARVTRELAEEEPRLRELRGEEYIQDCKCFNQDTLMTMCLKQEWRKTQRHVVNEYVCSQRHLLPSARSLGMCRDFHLLSTWAFFYPSPLSANSNAATYTCMKLLSQLR